MNFWLLSVSLLLLKNTTVCDFASSRHSFSTIPVIWLCVCTGFDLCEVGQEEVVLKTGKLANRRTLHFALQSLLALFGKYG